MAPSGSQLSDYRLAASLHPERRAAPRVSAEHPVTVRTADDAPIDAIVENLSREGFAMSTVADLGIGSLIGLSVGGVLRRRVKIVRRMGLAYGCEFLSPLSELEVRAALRSSGAVAPMLEGGASEDAEWDGGRMPSLSYLARFYIMGLLVTMLWLGLIVGTRSLLQ